MYVIESIGNFDRVFADEIGDLLIYQGVERCLIH